ncbi:MAG: hypothetical protein ABH952_06925 [Candidatus Omnitrophota bacterium]
MKKKLLLLLSILIIILLVYFWRKVIPSASEFNQIDDKQVKKFQQAIDENGLKAEVLTVECNKKFYVIVARVEDSFFREGFVTRSNNLARIIKKTLIKPPQFNLWLVEGKKQYLVSGNLVYDHIGRNMVMNYY